MGVNRQWLPRYVWELHEWGRVSIRILISGVSDSTVSWLGQVDKTCLWMNVSTFAFLPHSCTMRIGRGIHPEGMPGWCQGFSLDGGSGVRALKVIQHGNRPGLIYNIGGLLGGSGEIWPSAPELRLGPQAGHAFLARLPVLTFSFGIGLGVFPLNAWWLSAQIYSGDLRSYLNTAPFEGCGSV